MNERNEIIKKALMDKLTGSINIYTADDILTVADISEEEIHNFHEKITNEIDELTEKKSKK